MERKMKKNLYLRKWLKEVFDIVGSGFLQRTFGSKTLSSWNRTSYTWTSDKEFETNLRKNPVESIKILLEHLKEQPGGKSLVHKYAVLIAEIADGTFTPRQEFEVTKKVEEECLEDYPELVKLHELIRDDAPIEQIEYQTSHAKKEIDETLMTVKHYRSH